MEPINTREWCLAAFGRQNMRLVYALLFFVTMLVQHFVVTRVNTPDFTITDVGRTTPPVHQAPAPPQISRDPLIDIQRNDYPRPPSKSPNNDWGSAPSLAR